MAEDYGSLLALTIVEAAAGLLDADRADYTLPWFPSTPLEWIEGTLNDIWGHGRTACAIDRTASTETVRSDVGERSSVPWKFGFTPTFRKTISAVDKALQGRVLMAISELVVSPVQVRGDTVKPLTGDRAGLWRYRIGDFRLVYEPVAKDRTVVLLLFAPRGGVYD